LNLPEVSPVIVDSRGRCCPVPVMMLAKALRAHEHVELLADDPAARADVIALCEAAGHELVLIGDGPVLTARVRRRPKA